MALVPVSRTVAIWQRKTVMGTIMIMGMMIMMMMMMMLLVMMKIQVMKLMAVLAMARPMLQTSLYDQVA